MPFYIVRNDITCMEVDAIVNTANPKPVIGTGVDSGIHQKAGPKLLEARQKIGNIALGDAVTTEGFALPSKYVIHTCGPIWEGGDKGEIGHLYRCYEKSLSLALEHQCQSIAFPLISSGNYGFPKGVALQTAVSAISQFLMEAEMQIYLVVFDKKSYSLSENLFAAVESYIDEHYVEEIHAKEYGWNEEHPLSRFGRRGLERAASMEHSCVMEEPAYLMEMPTEQVSEKRSLQDLIDAVDDTFSTHLLRLIDSKGLNDVEVYKKANIDRKLFHKIKTNEHYKPSKMTAIALAIAMELNLDETKDLLGRAGYALSHSSVFDIVIEYFIVNGVYDIFEINTVLFEFDQPVIGC